MATINGKACVANGRNLIIQSDLKPGYIIRETGGVFIYTANDFYSHNYIATNGATTFTLSSDYVFTGNTNDTLAMYDSDKNYLGYQSITSATQTLSKSNVAYIRFSINFAIEGGTSGKLSDWLANHKYKLEKGSAATPLTPAPVDKVFSNGKQVYGRNLLMGTSNVQDYTLSGDGWKSGSQSYNAGSKSIPCTPGKSYTYSAIVKSTTYSCFPEIQFFDRDKKWITNSPNFSTKHTGLRYTSLVAPAGTAFLLAHMVLNHPPDSQTVVLNSEKLEQGTTATPWSPATEDVM